MGNERDINFQTPSENYKIDTDTLQEALEEAIIMINSSQQPVIVAGVELQRFGLQDDLLRLINKTNIPVVSTVLSESTISEDHPCFLGVYEGAMVFQSVREYVESSDCLILLGAIMTDINFGISRTPIEQSKSIYVSSEKLSIRHHNFENIILSNFLMNFVVSPLKKRTLENIGKLVDKSRNDPYPTYRHFMVRKNQMITVKHLFERLNFSITKNTIIITDVGDSLFGALDLTIYGHTEFFISCLLSFNGICYPRSYWSSIR
jgi:TPP-dependent 2-oxoacid decarboxylase